MTYPCTVPSRVRPEEKNRDILGQGAFKWPQEFTKTYVEFENQDAFNAMHRSPAHDIAGERVAPLFDGNPTPHFYEVAIG